MGDHCRASPSRLVATPRPASSGRPRARSLAQASRCSTTSPSSLEAQQRASPCERLDRRRRREMSTAHQSTAARFRRRRARRIGTPPPPARRTPRPRTRADPGAHGRDASRRRRRARTASRSRPRRQPAMRAPTPRPSGALRCGRLFRHLDRAALADHDHLHLARVLELILDLPRDLVREEHGGVVVDLAGSTMTRISRPACSAYAFATPGFAVAISSSASSLRM